MIQWIHLLLWIWLKVTAGKIFAALRSLQTECLHVLFKAPLSPDLIVDENYRCGKETLIDHVDFLGFNLEFALLIINMAGCSHRAPLAESYRAFLLFERRPFLFLIRAIVTTL
jgi:hypothetical protein